MDRIANEYYNGYAVEMQTPLNEKAYWTVAQKPLLQSSVAQGLELNNDVYRMNVARRIMIIIW